MSSQDFLAEPKPGKRAGVIVAIVVAAVALIAAGIAAGVAVSGDDADTDTADDASSATPSAADESTSLTILAGERQDNGVAIGYPHTTQGAVSAAVEFTAQIGSTLDYDRAADVAEVIYDPDRGYSATATREGIARTREALGVDPDDDDVDASIVVSPVAYQVRDESASSMTVLLLTYVTATDAAGVSDEQVSVYPMPMVWTSGDWKAVKADEDGDYSDLLAEPGTENARAKGWREITR